jgi:aminopeptidase-like protein
MMGLGEAVREELSGSVAKSYVAGITAYHRVHASPMMAAAAEHLKGILDSFGMDEVLVERYPSDGRRKYWTYVSAPAWSCRSAELRLVEPGGKVLARFADVPQSLHTYSKATPRGGVTAELVDVGKGTSDDDYRGKKVKGKMVLAAGRGRTVHLQAVVKRGAAGVVTDGLSYEFHGVRESTDIPDAHAYHGIWPTAEEARRITFGFSLSRRQGNELRRHLAAGKRVRLHAEVDAEISKGSYSVLTATIRGSETPKDEVFLVAHLCHPKPSANDNASGSGLLVEVARTMTALIRSGRVPRPKRTIRFLWVPETNGSVAFLSKHPELHARLKAGINLDMVGEDQTLCRSTLTMDSTPDSVPSYLNDLVFSMMRQANAEYDPMVKLGMSSNFRLDRTAHSGGSDHVEFVEATVGAPCVSLTQWPDMFYHTSLDTIDKVSEDSLRRVGWAATVSALTLADADPDTARRLAVLSSSEGMRRVSEAVEKASSELMAASRSAKDARSRAAVARLAMHHRSRLSHAARRDAAAVRSVSRLCPGAASDPLVEAQAAAVEEHGSRELARLNLIADALVDGSAADYMMRKGPSEDEKRAKRMVPVRLFKGSLDAEAMPAVLGVKRCEWHDDAERRDPLFPKKMYEVLNLMDGERDLCEIVEFVSAEYSQTDMGDVLRFVSDLRAARLVR